MNIQQVKAEVDDIGDGGEAITTESLTKYENACADLNVSLKEVKDGVWSLRDPMEVLEDLAVQFNKEADNSIKKANLINAVGGKYRGNQLASLLGNWDTYKKMLAEYNSQDAVGSAYEEAMKTADSWEGRLNKLSNTWTAFVQNFVNTDFVKSGVTGVETLIKLLDELTQKLGAIPTLISAITVGLGIRSGIKGTGGDKMISLRVCPSYTCGNTERVYAKMVA